MTSIIDFIIELPTQVMQYGHNLYAILIEPFYNQGLRVVNLIANAIDSIDGNLTILDQVSNLYRWGYDAIWNLVENILNVSKYDISIVNLLLTIGLPLIISLSLIKWIIGIIT